MNWGSPHTKVGPKQWSGAGEGADSLLEGGFRFYTGTEKAMPHWTKRDNTGPAPGKRLCLKSVTSKPLHNNLESDAFRNSVSNWYRWAFLEAVAVVRGKQKY